MVKLPACTPGLLNRPPPNVSVAAGPSDSTSVAGRLLGLVVVGAAAGAATAAAALGAVCCGAGWKTICPEGMANRRPAGAGREDIHAGKESGSLATSSLLASLTERPAATDAFTDPSSMTAGAAAVTVASDAGGREIPGNAAAVASAGECTLNCADRG